LIERQRAGGGPSGSPGEWGARRKALTTPSCPENAPTFGHHFAQLRLYPDSPPHPRGRRQEFESAPTEDPGSSSDYEFQHAHFCLQQPDPTKPTRQPFTPRERQRASFGLWNARSIASQAFMNLGHRDPYHLRLAQTAFGGPVTFEVLSAHIRRIRDVLGDLHLDGNLLAGTCDEPDCNTGTKNAVAVTLDDLSAVVLCPFYFIQPARTLATTLLHEAGHMANIDVNWTPGNERYCRGDDTVDCTNICPLSGENLLENVDAWARFIYCLSVSP
jgi:hypothetical protein